jgi:hypothetical protein
MTYKLTGLEPYQLPSNADLGTMAYQNAEALQAGLVNISNTLTVSGLIAPLTVGYSQAAVGTVLYLNQVPSNLMAGGVVNGTGVAANTTLASFVSGFSTYQPSFTATTATTVIAMTSTYGISASMAVGGTGITYGTVVSSVSGYINVTYQVTSATTAGTTIWIGTTTNVAVGSMVFGTGVNNTSTLVTVISANSYVTVNQAVTTTLGQNVTFAPTVTLSAAITANTLTQNLLFFPTVTLNQATSSAVTQGTVVNSYYSSSNATNAALVVGAGGLGVTGNAYFANNVTATNFYGTFNGTFTGAVLTATNIAGGSLGSISYQTAPGLTGFIGTGTTGAILQMGANTATFVTTASIYVGAATTASNLFGGVNGSIPYQTGAGVTTMLGIGTNGYVLTSNGSIPVWSALSGLSAGSATTATNIAGGTAGQLHYQIAPGNTGFAGPGSYGQFLMSTGASAPVYQSTLTQVNGNIIINSTASSTSTTTGALQVAGGVGIGGNLVANQMMVTNSYNPLFFSIYGSQVATPSGANYVLIGGGSNGNGQTYLNSTIQVNLDIGGGDVVQVTSGVVTIVPVTAASSTATGALVVKGGVGIGGGLFVGGAVTSTNQIITATTSATSTTTGALVVAGGAGIGGNLFVGGTTYLSGDLYIDGTQTVINSVLQATQDKTLTLGNTLLQASTNGAGIQIGSTTTPYISWLYDGVNSWKSSQAITVTTTATIQGTTNATSTNTGALIVAGGAGINGKVYVGGGLTLADNNGSNTSALAINSFFPSFTIKTLNPNYAYGANALITHADPNGTVWTIGSIAQGGPVNSTSTLYFNVFSPSTYQYPSVSGDTVFAGNGSPNLRISFSGTTTIYNTATSISTTTGAFQVVGGVGIGKDLYLGGNFYSAGVTTIANTASVSSTNTGALQVAGGVGVNGGMFVGGTVTATLFVGTFTGSILGTVTTATNIGGGTAGALPYQSNTGTTAFVAISTAGYVLQSSGSIPQWTNIGPTVLNDISSQFDGSKTVFNLALDQSIINTVVDSKDLEVVIGGQRLAPYVDILPYPWLTPYDSFRGFRVKNTGQLVIYNAPYRGDTAVLTLRQQTTTRQKRKYPYSATTIAFGD